MARDRKYARHCGQLKEFNIESDRIFFRVTFRSNDRLDGTGFNASYQFFNKTEKRNRKIKPTNRANNLEDVAINPLLYFSLFAYITVLYKKN